MSACTGVIECDREGYCDKHFHEEARLWKAFFGPDTAENAANRRLFLEDHQLLMSTQLDGDVECVDLE